MKIAIASDDGKNLSMHFGRAKGFVIAEVENNEVKSVNFVPNSEPCNEHGNCEHHGEHHSRRSKHERIIEALKGVDIVISGGMGASIYEELKSAGKQVYVTDQVDVMESIKLYLEGKLPHIEELLH
ncbi:MAG: NifB/NifX family molybdenum-iron cluster-binding protein [bacterium]|nr:NifB/NifX family molybdenum-iron cluster-binding protein [bacterium]